MNNLKNKLIDSFQDFQNSTKLDKNSASFKNICTNFEKFSKLGFPIIKDEEYKYTKFTFLNNIDFNIPDKTKDTSLTYKDIESFLFDNINSNLLVFENGKINWRLTKIQSFRKGIIVGSLKEAIENNELVPNEISQNSHFPDDKLNILNQAFLNDGAFIQIPDGTDLYEPLHLAFFSDTRNDNYFNQIKNIINIGECCNIKIIISYHTIGDKNSFSNISTDLNIGNFSNVEFYNLQNDSNNSYIITNTNISQKRGSVLNSAAISLHGAFIRNNLNAIHLDEMCESNYNGFYYVDQNNFVDNHTLMIHAKPNCISNETYKGIIDDNAVAVFNGKILVKPNSPKINAYQKNRNILLTDTATVNTKPQLEIFTDDVKCSHGATTGYLEKEHIFYLKARGIDEDRARALLLNAFATEIIEKIKIDELRDEIKKDISKRLNVEDDFYFCEILESVK